MSLSFFLRKYVFTLSYWQKFDNYYSVSSYSIMQSLLKNTVCFKGSFKINMAHLFQVDSIYYNIK